MKKKTFHRDLEVCGIIDANISSIRCRSLGNYYNYPPPYDTSLVFPMDNIKNGHHTFHFYAKNDTKMLYPIKYDSIYFNQNSFQVQFMHTETPTIVTEIYTIQFKITGYLPGETLSLYKDNTDSDLLKSIIVPSENPPNIVS